MTEGFFLFILYISACYGVGAWGAKKKIGFGDALLLSIFLTPIVGALFVVNSKEKIEEEPWKKEQIPDGYSQEVRIAYSKLLSQFHEGEITEREFEQRKAELLAQPHA